MQVLRNNKGIPIEWEDIYYAFLFKVKDISDGYNQDRGIPFKTYIGKKCKFFALNYCRSYRTSKHRYMNTYIPFDEDRNGAVSDVLVSKKKVNVSRLSEEELDIYKKYFLDGLSLRGIESEGFYTEHRVRLILKRIRAKVYLQDKN